MRRHWALGSTVLALALLAPPATALVQSGQVAQTFQGGDYAGGQTLSILPPGANGLVNGPQALQFEGSGARPANSQDQLGPYTGLIYGAPGLTDAGLPNYYSQESFGVHPGDVSRVENPGPGVTIYRDGRGIPHIYGNSVHEMEFGAGYAGAEDRLFLMDVLRHYGSSTLSEFLGPSCADEHMDHDQLLLAPYTQAARQGQIDALPSEFGAQGTKLQKMAASYVAGINAYVAATQANPSLLPADYAAAAAPPQPWTVSDIISIASLVGGIFGKGGGAELQNAATLQYLQRQLGSTAAAQAFTSFREQNDPDAPTTIVDKSFPYEIPSKLDPSTNVIPDNASAPLSGGPTDTTPACNLTAPNPDVLGIISGLLKLPKMLSNALVVDRQHSASGHPTAVFGPQVGYFAPQILMQEDLHAPDFAAEGASFAGTNLIVELGRGADYAWSATSAGTDNVDQRLEQICNPNGGAPDPQGKFYEFNGHCQPMTHDNFTEVAVTKAGGLGAPTVISHDVYQSVHGVIQGWTTAQGRPVALVTQRSTFNHELDSAAGFLRWNTPSQTHDAQSWYQGAQQISYTFNWFYVDNRDIAYYVSGADPVRPSNVDPNLPSSGTGNAEWQGFLPSALHPHEIDPKQGFFTSWNNKPAPQFSAADEQYGYGPVYRSQSLDDAIRHELQVTGGKLTRANLVTAMESAATVDLSGRRVLPELLPYVSRAGQPAGVADMLSGLQSWLAAGAPRKRAQPSDGQYAQASAVATMDELYPRVIRSIFDQVFAPGGVDNYLGLPYDYAKLPMDFANTPNSKGANLGSAYDGGWEGYMVKVLRQLRGEHVAQPFPQAVLAQICGGQGPSGCPAAINGALSATYQALVAANGGSTDVVSWTQDTATKQAGTTMPLYDAIHFQAVGIVPQPASDWQNRPTFQQVVTFPGHRLRAGAVKHRRHRAARHHRRQRPRHRSMPAFTG